MGPLLSYSAYLLGVRGVRGLLIRPKVGVEAGSPGGWGGQPPKAWTLRADEPTPGGPTAYLQATTFRARKPIYVEQKEKQGCAQGSGGRMMEGRETRSS